ncbi:MAG: DUF4097 domain-containing protein [candidate division KSB1 bacterium]|nr:DUF4097 domain-containing protein [candidate division KSB1 bacterium]
MYTKRLTSLILAILIIMSFTRHAFTHEVTKVEEKTFKMKPGGFVTVICDAGFIKVESWDKEEVYLKMTKRAWDRTQRRAERRLEDIEVDITHTENRLTIREIQHHEDHQFNFFDLFDPDRWGGRWAETLVDFELKVPKETDLRLETDEGDIEVTEVHGDINIDTDEGEIELKNITFNNLDIRSDEGDFYGFRLDGKAGRLSIESDEGYVRLEQTILRELEVDTDESEIVLIQTRVGTFDLATDEGDVEVELEVQPEGRYRISSNQGNIIVSLPQNVAVTLDLRTESGSIRTDFPVAVEEMDEGERVRDRIGQGGARLEVYTDEGDIRLEKR